MRDPAAAAVTQVDDAAERRDVDRAVGISAVGLALTGVMELVIALFTGSVGGVDDDVVITAKRIAAGVEGIRHAHARARGTGRTLGVEIEGWVDPGLSAAQADQLGVRLARDVHDGLPGARSVTFMPRAMPRGRRVGRGGPGSVAAPAQGSSRSCHLAAGIGLPRGRQTTQLTAVGRPTRRRWGRDRSGL